MSLALRTPLCGELGIEYPIFSVGFGVSAGPELVAAVSNAGGCGVLGGIGVPTEELQRRIARVRELSDRPFGVNVIIADVEDPQAPDEDRAEVREQIALAVEARVPLLVLFWGPPAEFVEGAHRNGVKVFIQVGSLAEAGRPRARGGGGARVGSRDGFSCPKSSAC